MTVQQDLEQLFNTYQIGDFKDTSPQVVSNAILNAQTAILTAMNAALGGTTPSTKMFNQAISTDTPLNGDATILESAYVGRDALLIHNSHAAASLGLAFGITNISLVNDTTIVFVLKPQETKLIELPTLASQTIAVKSLDGSQIRVVYHLRDDTGGA